MKRGKESLSRTRSLIMIITAKRNKSDVNNHGKGASLKSKRLAMSLLGEMVGVRWFVFASGFGVSLANRCARDIDIVLSIYPESVFYTKSRNIDGATIKCFEIDFGDPENVCSTGRFFNSGGRMSLKDKAVMSTDYFCYMCNLLLCLRKVHKLDRTTAADKEVVE